MESRGNSGHGMDYVDGSKQRVPRRVTRFLPKLTRWLLCSTLLWLATAHAQTHYVYDANGRVVAVTQSNGTTVQYGYDALGHVGPIGAPLAAGQVAIFAFMPTHGVTGTQVTIEGQGFSGTVSSDSVSFNGTMATVLSASANQLVVNVPSAATTGPISVTVAGHTATSAATFVIDDTGAPPTITQVTPAGVAVGGTVTVTGSHLDPVANGTTVQMGGVNMWSVSSMTDTQLQYTVPSHAVSGQVTVTTPYGSATSVNPVALLPSSIASATNGAPSSYLPANGSPVNFSTGIAGGSGILTFDAPHGGNFELTLTGITITGSNATQIGVTVYTPGGTIITSNTCPATTSGASCWIPLWNLAPGTYSAVVSPVDTSSIIAFHAMVAPDTIGPVLTASTSTAVNLDVGRQVERYTFSATAGQTVALQLSALSTTPAGQPLYVLVYGPGVISPTNYLTFFTTSSSNLVNLPNLPTTGTYTVVVDTGNSGFPATAQLTLFPGVTGTVTSNGASSIFGGNAPSQNVYLSFTANAGDNLELELSAITAGGVQVQIYNPSGAQVASYSCGATSGPSCDQYLWNLVAGNYSVIVVPAGSGSLSFKAQLQPDVMGPVLTPGTPAAVNLGVGEVERFTFSADAGQTIALQLSDVSTTPAGQSLYVVVYGPGPVTTTNYYTVLNTASSNLLNLSNLPSTGTYTVVIDTGGIGFQGTAQLTLLSGVTATITSNSASQSFSAGAPGQNAYLSFTASAGDNLELELSDVTTSGGVQVQINDPSGSQVASYQCGASTRGSCDQYLWNLVAGTYSVIVVPLGSDVLGFTAQLQPDVVGGALTSGTPAAVNLGLGQVERFTFSGTAGQTGTLALSGVSTIPSGQSLYVIVYSPGTVTTTNYYNYFITSSSGTLNLPNLPVTGTYTVVIDTGGIGFPASAQLTLTAP